jgi:hypothetical protein
MDLALVWISEGLSFPRKHIMDREGEGEAVAMIATTHSSGGHNTTMHPLGYEQDNHDTCDPPLSQFDLLHPTSRCDACCNRMNHRHHRQVTQAKPRVTEEAPDGHELAGDEDAAHIRSLLPLDSSAPPHQGRPAKSATISIAARPSHLGYSGHKAKKWGGSPPLPSAIGRHPTAAAAGGEAVARRGAGGWLGLGFPCAASGEGCGGRLN